MSILRCGSTELWLARPAPLCGWRAPIESSGNLGVLPRGNGSPPAHSAIGGVMPQSVAGRELGPAGQRTLGAEKGVWSTPHSIFLVQSVALWLGRFPAGGNSAK